MRVSAIILAAGFGTRLAPLTDHTPKPLLQVGGKPVVSHLVARLTEIAELESIVVVANDRHLDQWATWVGDMPVQPSIHVISNGVVHDQDRLGAVADLARGVDVISTADWIMVLAGDNLLDEPLQPHLDAARAADRAVVLCRDLGDDVPPGRFGEVLVDSHDRITRFREKPTVPESPLAATCSYVLPKAARSWLGDYLASGGDPDSPGRFVGWLAERESVLARIIQGQYHDIGNHETLAAARMFYTQSD